MAAVTVTTLQRAETFVSARLLELERQISEPKPSPEVWRDYVDAVTAFTRIRALYLSTTGRR